MNPKQELNVKFAKISKVYDVDLLLALKTHPNISSHRYTVDTLPLPLFQINSRMGSPFLSSSKKRLKAILESVWFVDTYMEEMGAKNVLEVGTGSNGGSLYFAWKYPDVKFSRLSSFEGELLHELKKYRGLANYKSIPGTFEKLAMFEKNSYDIVFSVETLSLMQNRKDMLKEIYRILKPGGRAIVVDGYLAKAPGSVSREELIARHLIGRGKSLREFETYENFLEEAAEQHFHVEFEVEVSNQALSTLVTYEKQAERFFKIPLWAKFVSIIRSSDYAYSMISNYLMPSAVRMGMALYKVTVLKKVEK